MKIGRPSIGLFSFQKIRFSDLTSFGSYRELKPKEPAGILNLESKRDNV